MPCSVLYLLREITPVSQNFERRNSLESDLTCCITPFRNPLEPKGIFFFIPVPKRTRSQLYSGKFTHVTPVPCRSSLLQLPCPVCDHVNLTDTLQCPMYPWVSPGGGPPVIHSYLVVFHPQSAVCQLSSHSWDKTDFTCTSVSQLYCMIMVSPVLWTQAG